MSYCSLCDMQSEDTELFFITKRGSPRHICKNCAALYETATRDKDPDKAEEALNALYTLAGKLRDLSVLEMLSDTLSEAKTRIEAIRNGSYDFALDEEEELEDTLTEIPEELRQDPEEAEAEAAAEEATKEPSVGDHILNWLWVALGIVAAGVIIFNVIMLFF